MANLSLLKCPSLLLLLSLCAILAAADSALDKRQGTSDLEYVDCAGTRYSRKQVNEATAEACRLYANHVQIGSGQNGYPHRFNNFEGIRFATDGPYEEFPIRPSGNYTAGAPGPDRVVINPDYRGRCVYVGAMTHTGALQRNGFVSCDESAPRSGGGGSGHGRSAATSITTPDSLAALLPLLALVAL